jgi:hypothetical protein
MSNIVEALEAINLGVRDPYVILNAPKSESHGENYIQALATNADWTCLGGADSALAHYRCELRISEAACDSYQQWCLMLPDETGLAGTPEKDRLRWITGYYCDLTQITDVFMAFIADSSSLPRVEGWVWLDITDWVGRNRGNRAGTYGRM